MIGGSLEERPAAPILTSLQVSSSKSSPALLALYSRIVRAKIPEAWTIPENLLKEMVDLEAIIVVIIDQEGRVQRPRFDKKIVRECHLRSKCYASH
jgi:hypothetical protein